MKSSWTRSQGSSDRSSGGMPLWLCWTYDTHTHTHTHIHTLRHTCSQRHQQTANTKSKWSCHSCIVSQITSFSFKVSNIQSSHWYWKKKKISNIYPRPSVSFICFSILFIYWHEIRGYKLLDEKRLHSSFLIYKSSPYFQLYYQACDSAAHLSGQVHLIFEFLPPGPEFEMEDQMAQMASAPFPALCSLPNTNWSSRNETCINFNLYLSCWWPAPFTLPSEAQITPIITLIPAAHGVLSGN